MKLACLHDERVKFVEELVIAWERGCERCLEFFVASLRMRETVPVEDAASVGVDHKHGMLACVKQNGVGGFGADTAKAKKLFAQACGRGGKEAIKRTSMPSEEEPYKSLKSFALLAEVAGRAEAGGESRWSDVTDCDW